MRKGQKATEETKAKMSEAQRKIRPSRVILTCKNCLKQYEQYPFRAFISFACSNACKIKLMKGRIPHNKGTGKLLSRGYKLTPSRKREHRTIFEGFIGRNLKKTEVIHHCDKNKLNNSIENLQLFRSQSAHKRLHHFAERHKISMELLRFEQSWLEKANLQTL